MRVRLAAIASVLGIVLLAFAFLQAPAFGAATPKFLTLPFAATDKVVIQRAWWTVNPRTGQFNLLHHGIDYVAGKRDVVATWKNFDALAAAAGEACGAKTGQRGCFDSGEIMGNRVLIKHKVEGQTYYTFYNHLDSIAKDIPLNDVNKTVHVDAGQKIGVVGSSNSPGFLHLHWELLDANLKPLDPYGIKGISDQYPDPRGKNGRLAGKNNYFLTNPPTAFGATAAPSPSPSTPGSPDPSADPSSNPGATTPAVSPDPGSSGGGAASGSPALILPSPSGGPGGVASSTPADGGLGVIPVAAGVGVLVVGTIFVLLLLASRRRSRALSRDRNWRP